MHPLVKIFMFVWFSFLAFFSVMILTAVQFRQRSVQSSSVLDLVIPAGMAVFGVALVKLGWWLGRNEKTAILTFLKSTFETDDTA